MGSMKRTEYESFISSRNELYKNIGEIIGLSESLYDNESLIDETDCKWKREDGQLLICRGKNNDVYSYAISSYSAKGERFFIGESDGLTYVMCYPNDGFADDDSRVYVLDSKLIDPELESGW
jgi:hypothetical protein